MFGLEWLTIPVLLTGISVTLAVIRFLWTRYWSRSARAEKVLAEAERDRVRLEAERERLKADRERVQREPNKSGQALEDDINETLESLAAC